MDNKITKKRLSNFLSYEWILMLVVTIAVIIVWEMVYSLASVKISTGQKFKFYYDEGVSPGTGNIYKVLEDDKTFSYDIVTISSESINSDFNVLETRLGIQEGDAIFSNSTVKDGNFVRTKNIIDKHNVYDFHTLLRDACDYVGENFLTDQTIYPTHNGVTLAELNQKADIAGDFGNLEQSKIESFFLDRMKHDNRYRTEQEKKEGKELEVNRIKKLCKDIADFKIILNNHQDDGLLYKYTKYEQVCQEENVDEIFKEGLKFEKNKGRENIAYGINLGKLLGEKNIHEYFHLVGKTTADNIVVSVFNFKTHQKHLQYEALSFINTLVRTFGDNIIN